MCTDAKDVNDGAPVGQKDQRACAKELCVVGVSKERQHSQWLEHVGLQFEDGTVVTRRRLSRLEGSGKAHFAPGDLDDARPIFVGDLYGHQFGRVACFLERQRDFRELCTRLVLEDRLA